MAWLTSPDFQTGDAEADLTATILAAGSPADCTKNSCIEKQIAQDVGVNQQSLILGSVFEVQGRQNRRETRRSEKAINAELEAFRKDGPTAAELTRARNVIDREIIAARDAGRVRGVADR